MKFSVPKPYFYKASRLFSTKKTGCNSPFKVMPVLLYCGSKILYGSIIPEIDKLPGNYPLVVFHRD